MNLLASVPGTQPHAAQQVGTEFKWIAAYCVSLLLASHAVPIFVRNGISRFRLDRDGVPFGSVFRFHDAPWYYLLTGADFREDEKPDVIIISAIVEVANDAFLYVGVLDDFLFDTDGRLDRLILQKVVRRPVASDKPVEKFVDGKEERRFYPIDGDNFVLRYSEAITLNVQYIKLTATEAVDDAGGG